MTAPGADPGTPTSKPLVGVPWPFFLVGLVGLAWFGFFLSTLLLNVDGLSTRNWGRLILLLILGLLAAFFGFLIGVVRARERSRYVRSTTAEQRVADEVAWRAERARRAALRRGGAVDYGMRVDAPAAPGARTVAPAPASVSSPPPPRPEDRRPD